MALPSISLEDARTMTARQRMLAFFSVARFVPDAPKGGGHQYAIRVGSKTLYDDDTYELRKKFDRECERVKRRKR